MQISITDIVAIVSILLVIWKTFFSKDDKRSTRNSADKDSAEAKESMASAVLHYEEILGKQAERISKLEEKIALQETRIRKLEAENRKLENQLSRKSLLIDCLEVNYRELAQKALDAGVKGVDIDAPCSQYGEQF